MRHVNIQQNFTQVVEADEFLSLSSEKLLKFIPSDELTVLSEEKVFGCVVRWVKHDSDSRKCILPQLLEHVRLPLTSESGTLKSVEAYRPSTGVWTTMADIHLLRKNLGVVALEGLLYAVSGRDGLSMLDSVEFNNPITNTWTMPGASMNVPQCYGGAVAIDRPFNI
ncbi:kelch-like protein 2 [Acyrthosiphon pisum]|uniref:BACK domain-containing protein n=1 Tax=Acyrthosiphon pisum TaxID=7029 RepID=A0A8R2NWW0_ACYPI|nr:kelch-like protein 2 [Acyrthosiphon pisum]XP_029347563.1 kelch-like protein 2 [Acyrthosiphon pisum]|eukprot:XP_003244852.1 PREDICTED: kelch-like protein 2 [Acyrthosiphon pisum]